MAAGLALVGTFLFVESRLREGEAARSLTAGSDDRQTTRDIAAAFGIAMVGAPVLATARRGRLAVWIGWIGVIVMAAGLALRVWAARTLGAHYTRTLRVQDEQGVTEAGPYAYVRHPGYAGSLMMWFGFGLTMTSVPATAATTVPMVLAYRRRIAAEEVMLADSLGEAYRSYQERTTRLIPGVY